MNGPRRFREVLEGSELLVLPGSFECLGAKMIEAVGFEAVYVSGGGTSCTRLGAPDLGLTTMNEVVDNARRVVNAVDLPVFCDSDSGYGNALNLARTVREFEMSGVAGIHIEDQVTPKRCGQYEGKELISKKEMVKKIQAGCDARRNPDFTIMARIDAIPVTGFEDALDRAHAYLEAGADLIWMESTRTLEQLEEVGRLFGERAMHNIDASGKSPRVTVEEVRQMGFKIASFCGISIWAAAWAIREQMEILKRTGDIDSVRHLMIPWQETYDLLGFQEMMRLQAKFSTTTDPSVAL